jgi:hypothetical protein
MDHYAEAGAQRQRLLFRLDAQEATVGFRPIPVMATTSAQCLRRVDDVPLQGRNLPRPSTQYHRRCGRTGTLSLSRHRCRHDSGTGAVLARVPRRQRGTGRYGYGALSRRRGISTRGQEGRAGFRHRRGADLRARSGQRRRYGQGRGSVQRQGDPDGYPEPEPAASPAVRAVTRPPQVLTRRISA